MRTRCGAYFRLEEGNGTHNASLLHIEFHHARRVPQAAKGVPAIAGRDYRVWEGGWHFRMRAQINAPDNIAAGSIYLNHVVGKIVRDQQLFLPTPADNCNARGIRNSLSGGHLGKLVSNLLAG